MLCSNAHTEAGSAVPDLALPAVLKHMQANTPVHLSRTCWAAAADGAVDRRGSGGLQGCGAQGQGGPHFVLTGPAWLEEGMCQHWACVLVAAAGSPSMPHLPRQCRWQPVLFRAIL